MARLLWTQMQDIGPSGRAGSAMAFDPLRKKIVLFGGTSPDGGTWEWDGQYWTQVSDMGPSFRREHAMAWDNASSRVILFGGAVVNPDPGADPGQNPIGLGDTWEWDGENWTQLDDSGPTARFAFAVASDWDVRRDAGFDQPAKEPHQAALSLDHRNRRAICESRRFRASPWRRGS